MNSEFNSMRSVTLLQYASFMNKIVLTFFLFIFPTSSILAQFENIHSSQITTRDGLIDNRITAVHKDSRGFMWFGSPTGLSRYDGYNFTFYRRDDLDSNSISGNFIIDIQEDPEGNLWILTKRGLEKYSRKEESFTSFRWHESQEWPLNMSIGHSGKIWAASWTKELWQFDMASEQFAVAKLETGDPDSLFKEIITAILEDSDGKLWVGTRGHGIYVYDLYRDNRLIAHYQHEEKNNKSLSNDTVWSLYADRSGDIWVGTITGIDKIIQSQKSSKKGAIVHFTNKQGNPYSTPYNGVQKFMEDDSGIMWMRAIKGVYTYNQKTGQFSHWEHENILYYNYETFRSARTLLIDETGIIWLGLFGEGIMKFRVNRNKFDLEQHDPENTNTVSSNVISGFYMEPTGELWVGTMEGGLNKRIPGKSEKDAPGWIHYYPEARNPLSINSKAIRTIMRDRPGNLWVGTGGGGLNKLIEKEGREAGFVHFKQDPPSDWAYNNFVDIIYEDQADTLWIGTPSGLYIFNRQTEQFYKYIFDPLKPDSIEIRGINGMGEEASGELWISTWDQGLFKIAPPYKMLDSNRFTAAINESYTYGENTPKSLAEWPIRTICVPRIDTSIKVWVGTLGGGLFGLRQVKGPKGTLKEEFVNYDQIDGLPDMGIEGIEEDQHANLWITTTNGLSKFNPETETFTNYHEGDGLNTNVFGWLSHYRSPDGKLFFGNEGILSFYPDSLPINTVIPRIAITDIKLFNKSIPVGSDSPLKVSPIEAREITLSSQQNYLSIEYAALNYINTKQNRYKYFMEGHDIEWVDAGTERIATYQNLNPGRYTFRVIASNNSGIWNAEGIALKVTIKPPWWKTLVAYFSYLVVIAVLIYFYNQYRTRKMDREKRVLEDKVRERTIQLEEHKEELEAQKEELHQQKEELQQTLDYLKEMQNQLVQSEKLASIGQLTAGIAHEINNPVNYISAGIDSLSVNLKEIKQVLEMYDDISPSNVEEKLKAITDAKSELDYYQALKEIDGLITSIKSGSDRTTEIVKGLRTFSRMEEGELKEADIHEGIDLTLVMLHNKYKHHIEVVKDYGSIPFITCYPGKLNQVFMNIISNSIDAIEEKGTITIKTYIDSGNDMICISIKDTGKGMSEQDKAKIFDPFFTTKEIGKGTGLGLSVSHGIVEQHQGTIEVRSAVGEGTEFIVSLPDRKE